MGAISSSETFADVKRTNGVLDNREVGVRVSVESRMLPSPYRPDRLWGPPGLLYKGVSGALSPGVKRPGREAPTSAGVMLS
jgi:hypothetical protein